MEIVKGLPTAAIPSGKIVELWVASPTGDSSDSLIFTIECRSEDQARLVADLWKDLISAPAALNEYRAAYREMKDNFHAAMHDPDIAALDRSCDVCDAATATDDRVWRGAMVYVCDRCARVIDLGGK